MDVCLLECRVNGDANLAMLSKNTVFFESLKFELRPLGNCYSVYLTYTIQFVTITRLEILFCYIVTTLFLNFTGHSVAKIK